jgi:hypothetical protein
MSSPMFPHEECTEVSDNVFIHKPKGEGCGYRVYLNGDPEREHAEFTARMLAKAVLKLKGVS